MQTKYFAKYGCDRIMMVVVAVMSRVGSGCLKSLIVGC